MNESKGSQGSKEVQGTIYWKDKDINVKVVNVIHKRLLITIGEDIIEVR